MASLDPTATTRGPGQPGRDGRPADPPRGNFFTRALRKLASSNEELESEDLQRTVRETGSRPIQDCTDRERVDLVGTIKTVTIHPRAGSPALTVEMRDGSGTVNLVWLGRRRIPGIDPGRTIAVSGRISCCNGQRVLYNPKYELRDQAS
ncbi:RecG-like helicase [Friedmanniella endophytica]|uniref:RecG-like helicase n=1 Tax=Microlunatus kandeliicorticis TaxID=1759536 RepID=A0A7W3IW74_9ACTN|nr:OB-fold nucleic acid binding domain-containing protein [Microlunatus kandeliicorticis]MBA8796310.1 RecG-like helicase [Microlunatus kandeliicorticis]